MVCIMRHTMSLMQVAKTAARSLLAPAAGEAEKKKIVVEVRL